jgi:hypothetical protein
MNNKKHIVEILFSCAALVVPQTVESSVIVVSQTSWVGLQDYSPAGFGQSFTAESDFLITAVDLFVSASAGGSDVTLSIFEFDSSSSAPGPSLLGSGFFLETNLSSTPQWIRVSLDFPVLVNGGEEYAFIIEADDPGGVGTGWNNYGYAPDIYGGGSELYRSSSGNWNTRMSSDLAFSVIAVPEPSAVLLLGFACFGSRLGRRNRCA